MIELYLVIFLYLDLVALSSENAVSAQQLIPVINLHPLAIQIGELENQG